MTEAEAKEIYQAVARWSAANAELVVARATQLAPAIAELGDALRAQDLDQVRAALRKLDEARDATDLPDDATALAEEAFDDVLDRLPVTLRLWASEPVEGVGDDQQPKAEGGEG